MFIGMDPLYLVLRVEPTFGIGNFCMFLFRAAFLFRLTPELTKAIMSFLLLGIMGIISMIEFLERLSKRKATGKWLDPGMIGIYRELQVWNGYKNYNFCNFTVPPVILFGVSLMIVGAYGSIRMVGRMPWMLYPIVPVTMVISIGFGVTLATWGAKVLDNSETYLRQLSRKARGKYDRRVVKSLRPLRIAIGRFGRVDKELCTEIWERFTDYTSSLLITY